jgi:hypothetical protein
VFTLPRPVMHLCQVMNLCPSSLLVSLVGMLEQVAGPDMWSHGYLGLLPRTPVICLALIMRTDVYGLQKHTASTRKLK